MTKELLISQIERERKYCEEREVGSEEYVASLDRLMELEKQLFELEKSESELMQKEKTLIADKRDRWIKNGLEGVKVGSGIVIPLIGLVWITAAEKEITFTGALREYTRLFIPKK